VFSAKSFVGKGWGRLENPTKLGAKEVVPKAKKIPYRAVPIERLTSAILATMLAGATRLVIAIDVAKNKMMAGFGCADGTVARRVRFDSPTHTRLFVDLVVEAGQAKQRIRLVDQWRDTMPRNALRTDDLPLTDPPRPRLVAERGADQLVRVVVDGVSAPFTARWESDGTIEGDGPEVAWRPASGFDQLRVAVRTRGGVAVVTVRADTV